MDIYLSSLREVDYERWVNSIENNYNVNGEWSWEDGGGVKNVRKVER